MKKTLAACAALSMTFASLVPALAGETEGMVSAYDPATRVLTLDSGETFLLEEGTADEAIESGARVTVMFDDATRNATDVTAAE